VVLANASSRNNVVLLTGAMIGSAFCVAAWSLADLLIHLGEYLHFHRRLGEFQMYMTAGGIMMINLLIVCAFLSHPRTPRRYRWIAAAVAVPLAINLTFTFTRSSWLGFLGGVLVIVVKRSRKILIPLGAILLLLAIFAPPEMKERFMSMFDPNHPNNVSRVNMWRTGVRIIRDHPLFGIGDVGTETVWNHYSDPGWPWEGHLHNNLIMWLVTIGIAGCAAVIAIFIRMWRVFSRLERKLRDDWFAGSLALAGLAVIAGFQINGLFEWNFGDAEIITLVWAILGLILAADNVTRPAPASRP